MTGQLSRVRSAITIEPGTAWLRVETGRGLLTVAPAGPASVEPAVVVLAAGDIVVPARSLTLLLEPIEELLTSALGAADLAPDDPAVRRWLVALRRAHGAAEQFGDPRVDDPEDVERWSEAVLADVRAQRDRAIELRRRRLISAIATPAVVDADATDEFVSVFTGTNTAPPPHDDLCAAVAALIGVTLPIQPGTAPDDHLAELSARASDAGVVVRRLQLGPNIRRDLRSPVAAVQDGRLVALLPAARGTVLIDPTLRTRRRLTSTDVATLGAEVLAPIRELPTRTGWRDLRRIALGGAVSDFWLVASTAIAAGAASLVVPLASGTIFSSIVPGHQLGRLVVLVCAIVAVLAAGSCLALVQGRVVARIRTRVDAATGDAVWARLLRLPARFFADRGPGELLMRASVVDTIRQLIADSVVSTLVSGVVTASSLVLIFLHSPLAGLLTLAVVALEVGLFLIVLRRWRPLMVRQIAYQQELANLTMETVQGVARIRVFAAEERAFRRLAAAYAVAARNGFAGGRLNIASSVGLAASAGIGIVAVTAGVAVGGPNPTLAATYLVITTALSQVLGGVSSLISTATQLVAVRPQLQQLTPLLDTEPELTERGNRPSATPRISGGVLLDDVTFRYRPDGPKVLDGLSLRIEPGEFVAVVGSSGAGKSTLLRLLLGFEQPEAGTISYDGHDLGAMDLTRLRRQIGTVMQNAPLFPGSLAQNIKGARLLTDEQVWAAAQAVGLADEIRAMPMGMETVVVEGGNALSGGQRQRVVLARALAGAPKLMLLDEATSALDNVAQAQVTDALAALHTTRIVVAHRLSTIRPADRILVLDKGRIVQQGTFDELVTQPGLFADLARRQQATADNG
jgi:NHLM bacteriocin system ABC transporter ATP-binding protein